MNLKNLHPGKLVGGGIALGAVIIITYFIGKAVWNSLAAKAANRDSTYKNPTADSGSELSKQKAEDLAQKIYDAYNEFWFNSGDTVKSAFKSINSDKDFLLVKNAFGIRSVQVSLLTSEDQDLGTFIRKNFGTDVSDAINKDLAARGITYSV
jgi:hypothetical protein